MLSRAFPRARFACLARPPASALTKLPSRTWRPVQQQMARRHESTIVRGFKEQYRKSPFVFPFAIGVILWLSGFAIFYIPWYYRTQIIAPFHKFPEPVAKKLRRAIFYSRPGTHLDLREANKYFRQALAIASELGMDQFSPEVLGIKYAIAELFEGSGHYPLAADVLEIMRVDCQRWLDEFSFKYITGGDRARILKVMVQLNVKAGEIYSSKYMNEPENAERRLTEAVETALRETARRETEGVKEGEGDFLTNEEIGATMEALAHHYERYDSHYLATPLFLKALTLCPPNSCHGVVLMNNISTCLAQQTPPTPSASKKLDLTTTPPPPRAVMVDQARQWADKAIARAAAIAPPDRSDECDVGCAVATHNLGEFFEMEGHLKEARLKYDEAASLARAIGFSEGKDNAREAIKRVKALEKALCEKK